MENELYHHGVRGQKWGVRRYQNKDGSLTYAGKKRALKMQDRYTNFTEDKKYRKKDGSYTYAGRKKALKMKEKYSELTGKDLKKYPPVKKENAEKKKSMFDMTDDELRSKLNRLRMEKEYIDLNRQMSSLNPKKTSKAKEFISSLSKDVISPAAKNVGKQYLEKVLKEKAVLNEKKAKSAYDVLKEEVDTLELKKRKKDAEDYLSGLGNESTRKRVEEKRLRKEEQDIDEYERNRANRRADEERKRAAMNSTYAKTYYSNKDWYDNEYKKKKK